MNKLFRLLAPLDGFAWQRLLKFAASPFFTESERFAVFLRDLHQNRKQNFAQYADGYADLSAQAFRQLLSDTNEFVLLFLRTEPTLYRSAIYSCEYKCRRRRAYTYVVRKF